ncbi:MAG: 16S rRNA (adenine(1518)-N(6)/adenine(1519)-N(6))-dimethyltransferase RsmA [Saprospiraceae bacterium]|nr:16S rRNA (adenine(1518)-N(6)/adenine(1519)-N(6))-dimethyltransferase RsmA [Saprospiraceae bacterium]
MKAKKSYGQHFLTSEKIAEKIADAIQLSTEWKYLLEVGPGKGMLTKYLMQKPYPLTAVEADADMVAYLKIHYPSLNVIFNDFLKLDFSSVFGTEPFGLIGNFPYNISSQIVFMMIDHKNQIPEMVGMFQKEVAERIVATPNGKDYGILSILTQAWFDATYLFGVDKANFNPPPKVQSAVVRLVRKSNMELGCDEKLFKNIVKQTFNQRRKMLRNTLKQFVNEDKFLENPLYTKRPENFSVQDFINLTNDVEAWIKNNS